MDTLKEYIKLRQISVAEASRQIGCARQYIYIIYNGRPVGKKLAVKIEKWSNGFVRAVDLIQLKGPQ